MKKFGQWKTWQQVAAVGGGALAGYMIFNRILGTNVKSAPIDYGQIPSIPDPTGGPSVKWNPDPLAQELSNAFEGYNLFSYPEVSAKILPLQDMQVALLYNHYNAYYAQDYPTLTQLLENEWSDWEGGYDKAVTRLKSLGLNERGGMRQREIRGKGIAMLQDCGYVY